MNIVSVLADPSYAQRFRDNFAGCSMWEWGFGDDGKMYCREPMSKGMFGNWTRTSKYQLYIPDDTLDLISAWRTSKIKTSYRDLDKIKV